jgi:hypothetical protein
MSEIMNEDEFLTEVAELIGITNDNQIPIIEEEANIQENREQLILKVKFLEEVMQLRDGKPKSTTTLNEAADSNAPEGESKKDKALCFLTKEEINEINTVLSTQANTNTKKHPKFYNWDSVYEVSESDPPQLIRKQVTKKKLLR